MYLTAIKNPSSRFTSCITWLQGTFKYDNHSCLSTLASKLEFLFKDTFEWDCGIFIKGVKFDDSARSSSGIILSWIGPTSSEPGFGLILISDKAMDRLLIDDGETAYTFLFHLLNTGYTYDNQDQKILYNWKPTKIETTIDDFHKKISLEELLIVVNEGNFSGFKYRPEAKIIRNGILCLGSLLSDKRLSIYDRSLQSQGKIDSIRWEARWMDNHAEVVFKRICKCLFEGEGQLPYVIAGVTLGIIDFIDRKQSSRANRCERFPFWKEMIAELGRIKLTVSSS